MSAALKPLGKTTDLPCPNCDTRMTARPYSRSQALVWCADCGWNLPGTAKFLRSDNLNLFARGLWLLPFAIPVALIFNRMDPILGYVMDLALVVALFVPALIKSQANLNLARTLEVTRPTRPRRASFEPWSVEPELALEVPRPVRLKGTGEPVRGRLQLLRALWAVVFICGLLALTPIAHVVGPKVQVAAMILMSAALVPMLATIGTLLFTLVGHRELAIDGRPCEGHVLHQSTHMRRLQAGEWTLVSRYRYRFVDPHGTDRNGLAQEEGRAIVEEAPVTVLDSRRDPRRHVPYPACLYQVALPAQVAKV